MDEVNVVPIRPYLEEALEAVRTAKIEVAVAAKAHDTDLRLTADSKQQLTLASNNLRLAVRRLMMSLGVEDIA